MRNESLPTLNEANSIVAESYKIFRTNLSFANIDCEKKVIMFTSASTKEGKTTSVANTAITFAQSGKKVLLIECDLRKSRLHQLFEIPQTPGLTDMLVNKMPLAEVVNKLEELPNLHIITSGLQPPDPAELLGSKRFDRFIDEAKERYDMIFIDAPPVLAVTDAMVMVRVIDGVVLVLAAKETKREIGKKAKAALDKVGAPILGALLTKVSLKEHKYYNYYGKKSKKISNN